MITKEFVGLSMIGQLNLTSHVTRCWFS